MGMLIDVIREMYQQGSFDMWLNKESTIAFELMINADSLFFFIQAIVYCISVFGAFMMWNFKKLGFHLYTIAQILLVITTQIFIPGLPFPFFEVMISLVFISFYARFLKIMT